MLNTNRIQRVCVYGIIKNKNGEILFIKRSENDTHPGVWELPGGGVDFGEDPKGSIKREVREETGISVEVKNPVKVFSTTSDDGNKQTIRIVYRCKPNKALGEIILSHEHSAYKWILTKNLESFTE